MKIPKARQLPSGAWFVQLRINGESISITRPTEKAAVAEAMAVKAGIKEAGKKKTAATLREAIDNYIEARSNTLSPSTIRGYRTIQRVRFAGIMDIPVEMLDERKLQRACNAEAALCSAKTLYNAWFLVSSAIKEEAGKSYAVRLPQKVKNERAFLDADQIKAFLEAIRGDEAEITALLALHSMRRSEILALNWKNIDLTNKIIHVRESMVWDENGKAVLKKETKNASSRRDIPIMIPRLQALLESEADKTGQVVTKNKSVLWARINRACRSAGLPEVGIHGLRHSFASLAYSIGMPEKETMRLGGWANDGTMLKIYTHLAEKDALKWENQMAKFYEESEFH